MALVFKRVEPHPVYSGVDQKLWNDWKWQVRNCLGKQDDFEKLFNLSSDEARGFKASVDVFKIATTPYYASLASKLDGEIGEGLNPLRRIFMPLGKESDGGAQEILDPLDEVTHSPHRRIIHRYSDRALFLVTDVCSVYCRFCFRKRFTGSDEGLARSKDYQDALSYLKQNKGIREVLLSGGDPLTLSNKKLDGILTDLRQIDHIEIIRIGSRMPVVCPMRIDDDLVQVLKKHNPVFVMTHFNHPKELTEEAKASMDLLTDQGVLAFNQMVLLNGVNNHPAIVQALNRRLLYMRIKPYYMFQCDPSEGTDHLRTTIESGEEITRALWGHLSGLAMASHCVDIPSGGGKTVLTPSYEVSRDSKGRSYTGWDGVSGDYKNTLEKQVLPGDVGDYQREWDQLKGIRS